MNFSSFRIHIQYHSIMEVHNSLIQKPKGPLLKAELTSWVLYFYLPLLFYICKNSGKLKGKVGLQRIYLES